MRTLALTVAYDGTDWAGFQRQRTRPSVQQTLEDALSKVLQHRVEVVCAGRTDAGVHAIGQVVSFQTAIPFPLARMAWVTNRFLPASICVRKAVEREPSFHARFSAVSRRYWYVVQTVGQADPIFGRFRWQLGRPLSVAAMTAGVTAVRGRHDFAALCHRGSPTGTTLRCIQRVAIRRWHEGIIVDVQADGFLHQMVRLLVANVVLVGSGERPVTWLTELIASRDRHLAGMGAPPCGLFLMRIGYPPTVHPRWGEYTGEENDEMLLG